MQNGSYTICLGELKTAGNEPIGYDVTVEDSLTGEYTSTTIHENMASAFFTAYELILQLQKLE